jgi:hypothetical protein
MRILDEQNLVVKYLSLEDTSVAASLLYQAYHAKRCYWKNQIQATKPSLEH